MRLLNFETIELESFNDHRTTPAYAILSHTWGADEVLFQDVQPVTDATKDKDGWKKIEYTCRQAKKDGLKYCWVDTCCIDKSSSAELSEAINSMFACYQESKICYVYMVDVTQAAEHKTPGTDTALADRTGRPKRANQSPYSVKILTPPLRAIVTAISVARPKETQTTWSKLYRTASRST